MECSLVLLALYYIVTAARNRAAVRFGAGQTEAYGRAICTMLTEQASAHRGRMEPPGQNPMADEPDQRVHWGAGLFSDQERAESDTSKEVLA